MEQKAGIFALSCLLRDFPAGQANFKSHNGLVTLVNALHSARSRQNAVKIATLIEDLVLEQVAQQHPDVLTRDDDDDIRHVSLMAWY